MSNWGYVGLAYGLTYVVLIGYTVYALRRYRSAGARERESAGS